MPLSYIQGLSHRNLLGEDFTDCSFIFLYILCTMSIRQVSETPSENINCKKLCENISHKVNVISSNEWIIHIIISDCFFFCFIVFPPEHPEDARSGPLQSRHQTGWRLSGTSSSGCQVLLNIKSCRGSEVSTPALSQPPDQTLLQSRSNGVRCCSYNTFWQNFCSCYVYLTLIFLTLESSDR